MKWAGLIINKERGQSLLELLIAMGVFVLAVSAVTFLILDAYLADRFGRERMIATFLAKEGMEAVRSIRDNNWNNLTPGVYGLATLNDNWIFQGVEDDLSNQLKQGRRRIIIESIDSDRVSITSQVTWQLTEARPQEVSLVTYLTNWPSPGEIPVTTCTDFCVTLDYTYGQCEKKENDCTQAGGTYQSGGDPYCTPPNKSCCCF